MKGGVVAASFLALTRLQGLTHFRLDLRSVSAISYSSLVSALSSLPSLTSLDFGDDLADWPYLLSMLCEEAAAPLLLRLESLSLPDSFECDEDEEDDASAQQHDAFLCRLSSLPSPPALQRFSAAPVQLRAAGLLSLLSLPHLRELELRGCLPISEFAVLASSCAVAAAPLVSLQMPWITPASDEKDAAPSIAQLFLPRFPALRSLDLDPKTISASGGVATLHRLSVSSCRPVPRFLFMQPLSFPLLTELTINFAVKDAALERLLRACPQLLRLHCLVSQSWSVVLFAARHCPRLLELSAIISHPKRRSTAVLVPVASPFLPQLLILELLGGSRRPQTFASDLCVLRHFTGPRHTQLQCVRLICPGVTARDVLSLSRLPRLSQLEARRHRQAADGALAEVKAARAQLRQNLRKTATASADRDSHSPWPRKERYEADAREEPPLAPHQQQEARQRVLDEAAKRYRMRNVLCSPDGRSSDADTRSLFFARLRSEMAAAAAESAFERSYKKDEEWVEEQ